MTTSSSKRIIKTGSSSEPRISSFLPPVQTMDTPRQGVRAGLTGDQGPPYGSSEEDAIAESLEIVGGAKEESRQILLKANALADSLLEEAREQAAQEKKQVMEEARRAGYEEGLREGREKADEEFAAALGEELENFRKDMETALASVETAKDECLKKYIEELKDCVVAIAEKVIHISMKSSGEVIKRMIISETEKLKKKAWVKIYIEKSQYDMMAEADAGIISELSRLSDNIKFIVMEKENSGSCIVEMPEEIVDISVDTQLENIKEILENIWI